MSIVLYHHPYSRAAGVLWMLEEVGVDYTLHPIDIMKGAQKAPEITALNPMGKLPILTDDGTVVTESAAIGLYLADRYAYGRLAPLVNDAKRAAYLRWSLFAPSVIEPGSMARQAGWSYKPSQAGWGDYAAMLVAMESAIGDRTFILGETFSMADVIFGGTLRFMLRFQMIEPRPVFSAYADRLAQRPASQRADARNQEIARQLGLS